MIGDGLSHVGFGALAISTALGWAPLAVTIPVVVLAAFLLLRMSESSKIKGDAAIALISSSALAIGVITVSWSSGMNTDVNNYMFGSILAMSREDVILSVILSILVLILFVVFYTRIFAITFDETFAKATGVKAELYNMLLAFSHSNHHRPRHADDGCTADLQPADLPGADRHAGVQDLPQCDLLRGGALDHLLLIGMALSFVVSSPAGERRLWWSI